MEEAISLRVVRAPRGDGLDERRQIFRVHLIVTGHDDDDVRAFFESASVTGDDRRTDTSVSPMAHDAHARIARA
jgi:hypothetical protein